MLIFCLTFSFIFVVYYYYHCGDILWPFCKLTEPYGCPFVHVCKNRCSLCDSHLNNIFYFTMGQVYFKFWRQSCSCRIFDRAIMWTAVGLYTDLSPVLQGSYTIPVYRTTQHCCVTMTETKRCGVLMWLWKETQPLFNRWKQCGTNFVFWIQ